MKTKFLNLSAVVIVVAALLSIGFFSACEEKEDSTKREKNNKEKIIGSWTEKYPSMYDDGIKDTITFLNGKIKSTACFDGWEYDLLNDSIILFKNQIESSSHQFKYSFLNNNEIVFYNYINRSLTQEVKDIQYIKIR